MRIGVLTGGGDCPGLNATIRAIVRKSIDGFGHEVFGILDGWKGLVEGDLFQLTQSDVGGIIRKGGTILGTSRTNPYNDEGQLKSVKSNIEKFKLDALAAIGGDDTLGVATKLTEEGIPCVGVPKTIDNDLSATDSTFGFDTAVSIAVDAIDRLTTTAESHHRTMVVEVMGRHAGWIALHAGIAGSADCIMLPEFPMTIQEVVDIINKRKDSGKKFHIIVVSEGAAIGGGDDSITQDEIISFLRDPWAHFRGNVILVWDRLHAHRGAQVKPWRTAYPRLSVEWFPPYAPELNPMEYVWGHLKHHRLSNHGLLELDEIHQQAKHEATQVAGRQPLLRSFVHAGTLPIRF